MASNAATLPNSPLDQSKWSKSLCEARCAKHVKSLQLGSGAAGCCASNQDATPWCRWGATQATKTSSSSSHNAGVCSAQAIDRCVNMYDGQCGILETNAEAVCLAWPECGGVVCATSYNGYCLARATMDASLTTSGMYAYTKSISSSAPVLEAKIQMNEFKVAGSNFVGVPFIQTLSAKSSSGGVLHYFVFTCKITACNTDAPTASRLTSDLVYRAATLLADLPQLDASIKSGTITLSPGQWMTSESWWAELSKVRTKSIVIFGAVKNVDDIVSNVTMLKFIAPGTNATSEMQVITAHNVSATRKLSVKASMYHIYKNAQCVMKPGYNIPTSMSECMDAKGAGIACAARECNTNGPACGGFIEVKYPSSSDKQIYLGDVTKRELYAEPFPSSPSQSRNCHIKAKGVIKFALFTDSGANSKPYVC